MEPSQRKDAVVLASMTVVLVLATSITAAYTFGTGTSATMAPPVPHVSKNGCTVAALPGIVDDEFSTGLEVSPSGEFIVGAPGYEQAGSGQRLGLWHYQQVGKLPKGLSILFGGGVNSSGTVAGGTYIDDFLGVVGEDGAEELDPPDLSDVDEDVDGEQVREVVAINDSGDVAGIAFGTFPDEEPHMTEEAGPIYEDIMVTKGVLWPGGSGKPVELEGEDPLTHDTTVAALTEDSRVLGYVSDSRGDNLDPWIWDSDGKGHELPRLPARDSGSAIPVDVAGDWVLSLGVEDEDAYRWRLSDPDDAEKLDEKVSATSIDADGRVYGSAEGTAVLLDDGELIELPVLDETHGGPHGRVLDASDDGGLLTGRIHPSDIDPLDVPDSMRAVQWECER